MRWQDERYVRLYIRDTADWNMLPWESRALWPLLLRKLDRAGLLDLGKHGDQGLSVTVNLPLQVIVVGLAGLLADGCVQLSGTMLVVRNFVSAQEATASTVLRSREYRARQREIDRNNVTKCDSNVTRNHTASREITARHSDPCRSDPCRTSDQSPSEWTLGPVPSLPEMPIPDPIPFPAKLVQSEPQRESPSDRQAAQEAHGKAKQVPLVLDSPPKRKRGLKHPGDVRAVQEIYRAGWVARFRPADGKAPKPLPGDPSLLDGLLAEYGLVEVQRLVNAFLDDSSTWLKDRGHTLRDLPAKANAYRATRSAPLPAAEPEDAKEVFR